MMVKGQTKLPENDTFLSVAVLFCSCIDIAAIPLISFIALMYGAGIIGFTALKRGLSANWLVLIAMMPPLAAFFVYGENHFVDGVLFYILPLILLSGLRATKSWSVVSELMTLTCFAVMLVVMLFAPNFVDVTITEVINNVIAPVQERFQLTNNAVVIFASLFLGQLFLATMLITFLYMQLIKKIYDRYHRRAVKPVGVIDMSQIYALTWLVFLLIALFVREPVVFVITIMLSFSAMVAGGSKLHAMLKKLQNKKAPLMSTVVMSLYYVMMYMILPYSVIACVCVAYGRFFKSLLARQRK